MKTIFRSLLLSIFALSSVVAFAAPPAADIPSKQDKSFNARMQPFLKELNLTAEQKPKFLAIQKEMTTKWAEFQKLRADERKPKQQAFYKARHQDLVQLLSPAQMTTYKAIRARRTAGAATNVQGKKLPNICLTRIVGRHWLVGPDGKPFFAHGITHVGNNRGKFDFSAISNACKRLGFNAYGYGCPQQLRSDMPYLESWNHLVPISMYRGDGSHKFIDIFDPKEQARIEAGVKANCERSRNNPNCIGYCWTDLGTWPLKNQLKKNWVDFIRELPEDAPGRTAYQKFLSTWKGEDGQARDQAFLRLIAREYFRVTGEANKKYDPGHLIFGDRLSFYTYDEDVLKEMLPWIDAIAFQPHFWGPFPGKELDKIYKLSGKPILLCDFAIRFEDGEKDIRNWKLAEDSVAAGKAYTSYVKDALNTQYIIGVFWCNPVDTPKGFRKAGVKQGFFADGLAERPGLHKAVTELNAYREKMTPGTPEK